MTKDEFNKILEDQSHENKSVKSDDNPGSNLPPDNFAGCLEWCKQNKLKGEGLAACKANCWVQGAIKILSGGIL